MIRLVYLLAGLILGIKGVLFWQEYQIADTARSVSVMTAGILDGEWEAQRERNLKELEINSLPIEDLKWNQCFIVLKSVNLKAFMYKSDKDGKMHKPMDGVTLETSSRCIGKTIIRLDK